MKAVFSGIWDSHPKECLVFTMKYAEVGVVSLLLLKNTHLLWLFFMHFFILIICRLAILWAECQPFHNPVIHFYLEDQRYYLNVMVRGGEKTYMIWKLDLKLSGAVMVGEPCERIKRKKTKRQRAPHTVLCNLNRSWCLDWLFHGQTGVSIPDGIGQRMCIWKRAGGLEGERLLKSSPTHKCEIF